MVTMAAGGAKTGKNRAQERDLWREKSGSCVERENLAALTCDRIENSEISPPLAILAQTVTGFRRTFNLHHSVVHTIRGMQNGTLEVFIVI